MGVRLVARAAARLDRRHDHLEAAVRGAGEELVDGAKALVDDAPAVPGADDDPRPVVGREQLRDGRAERPRDALDRGDRRRRDAALHLGEEALGHARLRGELPEGLATGDAEGADARAEIDLDRRSVCGGAVGLRRRPPFERPSRLKYSFSTR